MLRWMWLIAAATAVAQVPFDQHLDIDKAEYRARRDSLRKELNAPLVLMGGLYRNRINDTNYEFRQESNFYYLTGFSEPGAFLLISPEPFTFDGAQVREVLFIEPDHPRMRIYDGKRTTPEEAEQVYGIEKAAIVRKGGGRRGGGENLFEGFMKTFVKEQPRFYLNTPIINFHEFGTERTDYFESYKRSLLHTLDPGSLDPASSEGQGVEILPREDLYPVVSRMRSIKSPQEIKMLQRAVDVTLSGHEESLKLAKDVPYEYQVEAAVEFAFRYNGAEAVGYSSIVGCGPNGTVLHYVANNDQVSHDQMYVLDAGAEYKNYTADITRSFPADGTFSKEQAAIYNIVLSAQKAGAAQFVAGSDYARVDAAIRTVLIKGLTDLGLITYPLVDVKVSDLYGFKGMTYTPSEDIVKDGKIVAYKHGRFSNEMLEGMDQDAVLKVYDASQFLQLCPHGWGHSVGLDVHDPAPRTFSEGMIWTIEPGIYIADRVDFDIDPAYLNIGVRIEDMYLITAEGNRCMSAALPREIPELEAYMKQKSHLLLRKHDHAH